MKKVLLTGASGFIGRYCVPILIEKGYEVHAVYNNHPGPEYDGVYWHHVDLLNGEQTHEVVSSVKPASLLHLAWYAEPGKFWSSRENFSWLRSSLALLDSFVVAGGRRVVMAGSCAEYDWRYGYCVENLTPVSPSSVYGNCKNLLRQALEIYSKEYSLTSTWGRVFFLYGEHEYQARLVPSVINSLINNEPALCTHGRQIRDFLYVEDVAHAFVSILESNVSGPVNVASGNPVRIGDIVSNIADKLNARELVRMGALESENEPNIILADINRLTLEVGWTQKYDLDIGLGRTIDWFKENNSQYRE